MKLGSFTGATEVNDLQVEAAVGKLGIHISGGVNATTIAKLQAIKVSIELISKRGGVKQLVAKENLHALAELSASSMGHFQRSDTEFLGSIDIAPIGSLKLDSDTYLSVTLTGLDAAATTVVYGIPYPVFSNVAVKYDIDNVAAATKEKDFGLVGVDAIALPIVECESVLISYGNGNHVKYLAKELDLIMMENNELVSIEGKAGQAKYNYVNYYILNVQDAVSMTYVPTDAAAGHNIVRISHIKIDE